jgi:hypothetical protein
LLAEDRLPERDIAQVVGVGRTQLWRWKRKPEFAELVQLLTQEITQSALSRGIAQKRNRVRALDERSRRLEQLARERAQDMANVPGGSSGYLTRRIKSIGSGKSARVVEEYEVDGTLLRQLRAGFMMSGKAGLD